MTSEKIIGWCNRIIHTGFLLIFALVPLLLTPWNYELFEYNKMMAVYGLTTIIVGSWLIKSIAQKEFRIAKTPLDIPIALFLISQLLSSLFSIDPHVSWLGYYSRFNGGMWSVISYTLLFYAYVTHKPNLSTMIKAMLSTASVVALYGVAERFGIDKHLWVQDVQTRVFSTLGQPNWLAAYLVALSPLAAALVLRTQISEHNVQQGKKNFIWSLSSVFWILVSILFFLVLLFTRSRSGLLGLAVADIIFWGLLFLKSKERKILRIPFIICHVSFIILFLVFGNQIQLFKKPLTPQTYTAPVLETGGTESGTIRKYVWAAAINTWKSSPKTMAMGTGTETFAFAFYQFRPAEHNLTSEWDFLYNKAHNEYLNYLATTGLFGLGSYLFFLGSFIYWFGKSNKKETIAYALFAGWVSILITNFFGFSVVATQLFLLLFPAMVVEKKERNFSLKLPRQSIFFVLLALVALLVLFSRMWYADTLFAAAYRLNRNGTYETSRQLLERASSMNPKEPFYHDELASSLSGLAVIAIEAKDATGAAKFAQSSIKENDLALMTSPKNVNFWKTRTKIFYTFSSFDEQFNKAAISALEHALDLSPRDPKILYNLAILYGREGNNDKAIDLLKSAIVLKKDYRDAYYALFIFYGETQKKQEAKMILQEYLDHINPDDADFAQKIAQ